MVQKDGNSMTQPLISVIVPCYNVEEYLPRCVESVLNQTYRNLEILLVDDGSPDRCGEICDGYAAVDSRVKVIHKENGGLSDARNVALDVMKGEYVTFVDSDDYVAADYVEYLYKLMEEYGVKLSVSRHQEFKDGASVSVEIRTCPVASESVGQDEGLACMFYQHAFDTTAWGKMYHRSLFSDGIRYPEGWLYEDLPTTYRLMMKCDYIAFGNYRNYFYRIRSTSIEGTPFKPLKYESCMRIIRQLEADKVRMPERVRRALDCRIVSFAFHILLEVPQEEKEMRRSLLEIIRRKRIHVLFDGKARRKARAACLLSLAGVWLVNLFVGYGKSRKVD